MIEQSHDFSALKQELLAFGDLKVWSVLVTILGDLAPGQGDEISGPVLSSITSRIGIRAEALRVALHRLRKDDWITVRKEGRISLYGLSATGHRETNSVRAYVYQRQIAATPSRYLVLLEKSSKTKLSAPAVQIDKRVFLTAEQPKVEGDALVVNLRQTDLPNWITDQLVSPEIRAKMAQLKEILSRFAVPANLDDPFEVTAYRVLVLHAWRRHVLRISPSAAALLREGWIGAQCREMVHDWLRILPSTIPETATN